MQPSIGHINSSLNVAKILMQAKYRVAFATHESVAPIIEEERIKTYKLISLPFGCGHEKFVLNENGISTYIDNLLMRVSDKLYLVRKSELDDIIKLYQPHYIFIDPFLSTDLTILFKYLVKRQIKVFFLQTMFPTCKADMFPPLSSTIIPLPTLKSKLKVRMLWLERTIRFNFWRFSEMIKYFGRDDVSIVKGKIRENSIPKDMSLEDTIFINYSFKKIPEFILAPQELEFTKEKARPNHLYIGGLITDNRREVNLDSRCGDVIEYVHSMKKSASNLRVIYCSFGSRYGANLELLSNFFERLFKVVSNHKNYQMIVSMNEKLFNEDKDIPSNIFILNRVDQLAMLRISDLFITHGGLNSIKESIHYGVPMLVYPLETFGDQPGNAARIRFHKLGLSGNIKHDSYHLIEKRIDEIIRSNEFRKNIAVFNHNLKEKYTTSNFINKFEEASSTYFQQLFS